MPLSLEFFSPGIFTGAELWLLKLVIAAHAQKKYIGTAAYLIRGCLRRSLKT